MRFSEFINYFISCFESGTDYNRLYFELLSKYQDLEEELNQRPTLFQFIFISFICFISGFMICFIILKGKI